MPDNKLIETAKKDNMDAMLAVLRDQPDVNVQDEYGWTSLNWAAGRGDAGMVKLLLEKGADCTLKGRDNRSAWMIARAAGHRNVADLLMEAEKRQNIWKDPCADVPYCRAYRLEALRAFPQWIEVGAASQLAGVADDRHGNDQARATMNELGGDSIVYVHEDYVVTALMWKHEDVHFDKVTPEWISFCRETLKFQLPSDPWLS